jgi:hypothetical protein
MPGQPSAFLSTVPCTNLDHIVEELAFDTFGGRTSRWPLFNRAVTTRSIRQHEKPSWLITVRPIRQSERISRTGRRPRSVLTAKPVTIQQMAATSLVTQDHQAPPYIELDETLRLTSHVDLVRREPLDESRRGLTGMLREPT